MTFETSPKVRDSVKTLTELLMTDHPSPCAKHREYGDCELELMAESFNLLNHQNVTELETTGYFIEPGNLSGGLPTLTFLNGSKANTTAFGQPLNINATDFYRERQIQVGMRMRF